MRIATLFAGIFKRSIKYFFRYGFDSIAGLVSLFIIFLLVFFGARAVIGPGGGAEETLSGIVVGYMVWMLGIFAYSSAANSLVEEASTGTLEQLAMSPFGLRPVLVAEFIASLVTQLAILSVMTTLMMAVSGRWLHIDLVSIVPIVLLTLAGVYGMGLMIGGTAIVFKRVQGFIQIVQFLMVILVAVPLDQFPVFRYLPLSFGRTLMHEVMVNGKSVFSLPPGDVLFLLAHTVAWLTAGLVAFGRFEMAARERALLGHY